MSEGWPTFKTLNTGDIANGSYVELTWTPDRDITLLGMALNERSDYSLANAQVYITVADVPVTKDFVPGSILQTDLEHMWKMNIPVKSGTTIYIKITNNTGNTINVDAIWMYK